MDNFSGLNARRKVNKSKPSPFTPSTHARLSLSRAHIQRQFLFFVSSLPDQFSCARLTDLIDISLPHRHPQVFQGQPHSAATSNQILPTNINAAHVSVAPLPPTVNQRQPIAATAARTPVRPPQMAHQQQQPHVVRYSLRGRVNNNNNKF